MAKIRGAHVASPSTRNPRPRALPTRDSTSEAPQALAIPPSEGEVPSNPPLHMYETRRPPTTPGASTFCPKRSIRRPPTKKAKVSGPGESSTPPKPQSSAIESQIPSGMTPEAIIRRYGILGAKHIAEALHIPYEPILEHLGYSSEPQLERRCICRELFTLDKWNHLTAYVAPPRAPDMPTPPEPPQDEQPPQAQQAKIPTEIIPPALVAPSIVPTPEATYSALPTTPKAPPIDQLIAMQTQHTIILSQIQQHLGILPPLEHDMPGPSELTTPSEEATPAKQAIPSKEATSVEQTMPYKETTTAEVKTPIQST
ncbi:WAS/WASL-interacting protein family member 3-like [Vitis riparia]|uniref:WAS/WASL-interacting protein family member 3-like n=1 Tax=Vitis riparia TaxID=96939 RepID=UPI00155B3343|nr:WAS/WASL-interacting protein family member 3-like [Vitis riparia]